MIRVGVLVNHGILLLTRYSDSYTGQISRSVGCREFPSGCCHVNSDCGPLVLLFICLFLLMQSNQVLGIQMF